jgi:3-oxoacyl-(acyl-carrier-protein) synthase
LSTQIPCRVVITGLGAISPNGIGREAFWQACLQGRSGIRQLEEPDLLSLPTYIAGTVPIFPAHELGVSEDEIEIFDRMTQFAVAASNLALRDSGLLDTSDVLSSFFDQDTCGVYMGTGIATTSLYNKLYLQHAGDYREVHDLLIQSTSVFMASHPAAAIASHHHFHGPCTTHTTACSSGADAIGQAFWSIQDGRASAMLAGGCDAPINAIVLNALSLIRALSTNNAEPEQASRPYDAKRDGFVLSEGAAVLLLEDRTDALARGATIYAEILAFSTNNNAYHMTALPESGDPLHHLLIDVMSEAQIVPQHIGYINSHGSSTLPNDRYETAAYKSTFGAFAPQIPISSTKSMIGHSQGAASALETIATTLALYDQILPPTINLTTTDPLCDLDYIPNVARPAALQVALTHSSGFGGVNTALVLAHPDFRNV